MGTRGTRRLAGLIGLGLLAVGGCASTGAPDDWLSPAMEAPQDPYGAWMSVQFAGERNERDWLVGEFLAVGPDSLFILAHGAPVADPVRAVPLSRIEKARLAHFDPETGTAAGWVAMGSVSTLSHGLGAGITLPLWIIMGSAMAAGHSRTPLEEYPNLTWAELRMYARFPQGPPPRLRALGLHAKDPWADRPLPARPDEPEPADDPVVY